MTYRTGISRVEAAMRSRRPTVTASSEASSSVLVGVPRSALAASARTVRSRWAIARVVSGSARSSLVAPCHSLARVART